MTPCAAFGCVCASIGSTCSCRLISSSHVTADVVLHPDGPDIAGAAAAAAAAYCQAGELLLLCCCVAMADWGGMLVLQ
jgi:hypothetical protein